MIAASSHYCRNLILGLFASEMSNKKDTFTRQKVSENEFISSLDEKSRLIFLMIK